MTSEEETPERTGEGSSKKTKICKRSLLVSVLVSVCVATVYFMNGRHVEYHSYTGDKKTFRKQMLSTKRNDMQAQKISNDHMSDKEEQPSPSRFNRPEQGFRDRHAAGYAMGNQGNQLQRPFLAPNNMPDRPFRDRPTAGQPYYAPYRKQRPLFNRPMNRNIFNNQYARPRGGPDYNYYYDRPMRRPFLDYQYNYYDEPGGQYAPPSKGYGRVGFQNARGPVPGMGAGRSAGQAQNNAKGQYENKIKPDVDLDDHNLQKELENRKNHMLPTQAESVKENIDPQEDIGGSHSDQEYYHFDYTATVAERNQINTVIGNLEPEKDNDDSRSDQRNYDFGYANTAADYDYVDSDYTSDNSEENEVEQGDLNQEKRIFSLLNMKATTKKPQMIMTTSSGGFNRDDSDEYVQMLTTGYKDKSMGENMEQGLISADFNKDTFIDKISSNGQAESEKSSENVYTTTTSETVMQINGNKPETLNETQKATEINDSDGTKTSISVSDDQPKSSNNTEAKNIAISTNSMPDVQKTANRVNEPTSDISNRNFLEQQQKSSRSKLIKAITSEKAIEHISDRRQDVISTENGEGGLDYTAVKKPDRTHRVEHYGIVNSFDWETPSSDLDDIKCVNMRTVYSTVGICIHDVENDPEVSANLQNQGFWEVLMVQDVQLAVLAGKNTGFIDIGAGIGVCALAVASLHRDVVAVEPSLVHIQRMQKSVQTNSLKNYVKLFKNVVSDRPMSMILSHKSKNVNDVDIHPVSRWENPGHDEVISAITLNDVAFAISMNEAVLRVHTPGFEAKVLRESEALFDRVDIVCVFIEWDKDNAELSKFLVDFFVERGYMPYGRYISRQLDIKDSLKWPHKYIVWKKAKQLRQINTN